MTDTSANPASSQVIENARALHRAGQLAQAEAIYQQVLQAEPEHPEALHLQGVLAYQTGRNQLALECLTKAIALNPTAPAYYDHLGSVYRAEGRLDEAIASYHQGLALKPDDVFAHYNLAVAYSDKGQVADAIHSFQRAIALNPDLAEAHHSLGVLLKKCDQIPAALACFREVLRIAPDHSHAAYLVATLTGVELEQAPSSYIASVFDGAAANFEQMLVDTLHYAIPQQMLALVAQLLAPSAGSCDILDLGCGTGLVGAAFAPYARSLVGVDLSAKMLEKAEARQLYQRLEKADLLSMMQGEARDSYDLILAADVLIYTGKLDAIFAEAKRLLRSGGLFAFSVEALDALADSKHGLDYHLNPSGRFAHSLAYIKTLAVNSGFTVSSATLCDARLEKGEPVKAWLLALSHV